MYFLTDDQINKKNVIFLFYFFSPPGTFLFYPSPFYFFWRLDKLNFLRIWGHFHDMAKTVSLLWDRRRRFHSRFIQERRKIPMFFSALLYETEIIALEARLWLIHICFLGKTNCSTHSFVSGICSHLLLRWRFRFKAHYDLTQFKDKL